MPRQPRLDAPGTLHHIMGRGIEKTNIFYNNTDRDDFVNRMAALCKKKHLVIYAWVLMNTHFHLLARTGNLPLSSSMRKLLTGYVVNFNLRHQRCGHLFQNRYRSIICEDDPYLLSLTRYIHLNPLRGGIVAKVSELNTFHWSGHPIITGKVKRGWQETETILGYFGISKKEAIRGYKTFIEEGAAIGKNFSREEGSFTTSKGEWSQVLSLQRQREKGNSDRRIFGSKNFVTRILSEAGKKEKDTLRLLSKKVDLAYIGRIISIEEGINEKALQSGKKSREIVRVRRLFCQLAVKRLGFSGAEAARYLGITSSAVNRMAGTEKVAKVDHYLKLLAEPTSPLVTMGQLGTR